MARRHAETLDGLAPFLYLGTGFPGRSDFGTGNARQRPISPILTNDRNQKMARRCELTGKGVMSGNNVSHALNRTRRRFLPNLCNVTLISDALQRSIKLRISANALRTVEHRGGLDAFLLAASDSDLSERALGIKQELRKLAAA